MKIKKIPVWLTIEPNDRNRFFSLAALYTIYVLPILLANRLYQDDLPRSFYGVTGWNNDARPLTEKLISWLCGGTPLMDVAPLPLFLSGLLFAYTLTLYAKRYLPERTLLPVLGTGFLVIANPFALSNLSYRFDCVTMILALCAAILPYVVPEKKALRKIFAFSFLLCLITLTTYQPCCGVYIALWFVELFFMLLAGRIDVPRLFTRGAACALSAIVYKYGILNRSIRPANGGWQPGAYQFSWRTQDGVFFAVGKNFEVFLTLLKEYGKGIPLPVILLFAALILLGTVLTARQFLQLKRKPLQNIFFIAYLILLPFLVTLGSLLPLLILVPSAFSISSHSLLCLCSFGLWAGVMLCALYKLSPKITPWLFAPCLIFGLTFSYTYGNALTSQKQYEEYLTYSIAHDVETLDAEGDFSTLMISGRAPRSPQVSKLCEKYPLLTRLVPTYLTNSGYLGGVQLLQYTSKQWTLEGLPEEVSASLTSPMIANSIYSCYVQEDKIIIVFHP